MNFKNIINEISDIEEYLKNQRIKIIPLRQNSKIPRDSNYYNRYYSIKELETWTGNFGIVAGYNHNEEGSLSVIDIDGLEGDYKAETAKYIYEILKHIPGALIVQTQSGGKHIYLWNKTVASKIHETSNHLHFPTDFPIKELRGTSLKHSIEIFTKENSKQCVLPGSIISEGHEYHVISEINTLGECSIVDNVHEVVKEFMMNAGFTYEETESKEVKDTSNPSIQEHSYDLKTLTKPQIQKTAKLITRILHAVDGAKHEATLYLGGYFSTRITKESAKKIAKQIIPEMNFNDNNAFINTLLNNYSTTRQDKKGLNGLISLLKEYVDMNIQEEKRLRFELEQTCNMYHEHTIQLRKFSSNKKQYLVLDYHNHNINTYTWNRTTDKEGKEKIFYTNQYTLATFTPVQITQDINLLNRNTLSTLHLQIQMDHRKLTLSNDDIDILEKTLMKQAGLILKPKEFKGILSEIIHEYHRLGQVEYNEKISIPGVYLHPDTKELLHVTTTGFKEIQKPSITSVLEGLNIWSQLQEVYPGDPRKLATIIRWGLLAPFEYILKTEYTWIKGLYLYGASRTAKTTLAEISLQPYTPPTEEISIGGGAFNTEYRIGRTLSRQGYGVIVNEPLHIIEAPDKLEIIKRAKETQYCREKYEAGIHRKIPAYSNMCFTSNHFYPTNDAFVRRFRIIEFTSNERLTEDNMKLFRDTFHYVNNTDNDFQKLQAIGEYVLYYIHENIEILKETPEVLLNKILDSLIMYAEEETGKYKWLYEEYEDETHITSTDTDILEVFRSMILNKYSTLNHNIFKINDKAQKHKEHLQNDEVTLLDPLDIEQEQKESEYDFQSILREQIREHHYDYLTYNQKNNGEEHVYITASVRQALYKYDKRQVTCKNLASYMGADYKSFTINKKRIKGFRMEFNEFTNFLN